MICAKAGTEIGLAHVAQLGSAKWQMQSYMKFIWAVSMGAKM